MENKKLKRTPNFTNFERNLLIKIANDFKNIIENKKTDGTTWKEKEDAWASITMRFNSATTGPHRSVKQLRCKYEAVKKELKKRFSDHKRYVGGTGGGTYEPAPSVETEEEKKLLEAISLSVQGLYNPVDSDANIEDITVASEYKVEPQLMDCAEEIVVVAEEAIDNTVGDDWSQPTTKLLQTPKRQVLKVIQDNTLPIDGAPVIEIEDHEYCMEEQRTKENDLTPAPKISLLSRRRPVLKKKKCMSSAAGSFENLASKKLELVEIQKKVATEQLKQNQAEHELRLQILNVQLQIELKKLDALHHAQS